MSKNLRYFLSFIGISLVLFLAWYFKTIVAYILIAAVISILGHPLVQWIEMIPSGRRRIPRSMSTFLALMIILAVFIGLLGTFVPLIASQAKVISSIDLNSISTRLRGPISELESWLYYYGILPSGESLPLFVKAKVESVINFASFSNVFSRVLSFTGSLFIGGFSVLFMSFFFIKDERFFLKAILLIVPSAYDQEAERILADTRRLLSRYFIGLCIEMFSLFTMLSISLWIAGIKNAILIAFFAGILNVIPYLGYFIGIFIGLFVGITGLLALGVFTGLLKMMLIIILIFAAVKLIDDVLLQPLIYSNSVKAHPLEIFIVIMVGATIAGIPGMILAVPSYTVIRVIAREFFNQSRIVQRLTQNL